MPTSRSSAVDLEITGFDADEIEKLFADPGGDVADDDFDLTQPPFEQAAFVLPGDVWTLGRHRLICGDATGSETVRKLMDGRKANSVLTDPPYNVSFESVSGLKIKNDSMKAEQFYIFLLSAFKNLYENLADGGAFYCFHSDSEKVNFFRACVDAGFHYSTTCIWVKNALVLGRGDYQQMHEPVLYAFKNTSKHKVGIPTVSRLPFGTSIKPKKNADHPDKQNPRPAGISYCQQQFRQTPSSGHFRRLRVDAHRLRAACRTCYMLELDEKYASVIFYAGMPSYKQNGGEDITCERDGKVFQYADLVKEVAFNIVSKCMWLFQV